jgi:predicted nucleic acid-binding Zn ribbon protein
MSTGSDEMSVIEPTPGESMVTSPQVDAQAAGKPDEGRPSDAATSALRRATAGGKARRAPSPKGIRLSGARSDSRDPRPIGDAVEDLISDRGWTKSSAVATLGARWPEIVGVDLAGHVTPESFNEGTLVLRAESTAWATQVRLLLPNLRIVIDQAVGKGTVADISVVGPQAPSWVAGPRRVAGRGPRDTYG